MNTKPYTQLKTRPHSHKSGPPNKVNTRAVSKTGIEPVMLERRFAFDLELLLLVIHYGYGRTVGTSSTDPSPNLDFDLHRGRISCLLDTASKFFYNARIRRHYSIRANRTGYVIAVTPSQLRQS